MSKVWFITGASKGFGREWAEAALERGDQVAATARQLDTLDALVDKYGDAVLPTRLDVTDRAADFAAVAQSAEYFGRLDVVVNNAGYGHFGMIEELTEDDTRAQLETNLFGALWVTQAALPICGTRARDTSSRCRASVVSAHFRPSARITPRSGRWKVSAKRYRRKSPASGSR